MRNTIISNVQIAVVDHERLTREFVAHVMMYSVNREILVFENAETIMEAVSAGKTIHLVLSEIHLPGRSGFELLRSLKEENPGIYLIAMSANPGDETPATELGADAFLAKPFALKDLFGIVQHFVVESSELQLGNKRCLEN
ncbi:MAG: response regulator [Desulfobacteraceae bacterium]|nr:MAG: response regulator [Desulfobacteraceae bacterium]